jgi:hypothetical protein
MATLELIKKEGNDFILKVHEKQNLLKIDDTLAEMFLRLATSPTAQPLFFWICSKHNNEHSQLLCCLPILFNQLL